MFRTLAIALLMAAMPSSANYVLNGYGFDNGGGASSGGTYSLNGGVGETGGNSAGGTYLLPSGIRASTSIPVPAAPTLTNPATNYDRLQLTLNVGTQPTDIKYLIAISSDGFASTNYVQPDNTIGSSLGITNYQTYAAWGGASGFYILGLASNTTYAVKIAALQGNYTGSAFGPTATAATSAPTATFALNTSLTSSPPFTAAFASLPAGSVTAAGATITGSVSTNAANGGAILVQDQWGGLKSTTANYTLASATADLSSTKGYGAQISAISQGSGGPMVKASPYNGSGNSVGALATTLQPLATFTSPVNSGVVTYSLIAKTDTTVPSAGDYSDTITLVLSLQF